MFKNWNTLGLVLLLSLLAIFVYACGTAQVSATLGRITGKVLAADGSSPIAGASVYYKSDSTKITTTDATGTFTLEGSWIVAGTYTLVAEKGSFKLEFSVTVVGDGATTNVGSKEVDPNISTSEGVVTIPDLGVVKGTWDSIENIITSLGYSHTTLEVSDLNNYNYISTFEAIFINCGASTSSITTSGEANLKRCVTDEGHSLYASDWAATVIESLWPTAINWYRGSANSAKVGVIGQTIEATVVDANLRTVLGKSTAEVYYDQGGWVVISSEGTGTTVLLTGNVAVSTLASALSTRASAPGALTIAGTLEARPLAVRFKPGGTSKGTVIYTTFHNEAQASDVTADMRKILRDFIFSL